VIGIVIGAIIATAAAVGVIAFIAERFEKHSHVPNGIYENYIKRPLDAFLATGALIVLSPILLITAILVRTNLGSPVLFTQDRPGRDEKIFKLYKFRTMIDKTDGQGNLLPDDIRLTSFGKKLRATSLDELPELINIIKGDMAVVGPRPLLVKYLPYYSEEQHHRHDVRPGLTGYAQAHGRNTVDWDDKFQMDVYYAKHITFKGDLQIILNTVKAVFKHEGISSSTSATMESFIDYCKSKDRVEKV
jgi:lipopolysaccharide/colanic/teichoic acid biosynthesis glycosyltransferase